MTQAPPQQININIDEKVGEGIYSNMFVISYSPSEFILDFARMLPGIPNAKVYSRILTTPQHAKQLLKILQSNIETFEKQNGEIKLIGQPEDGKGIGFKKS